GDLEVATSCRICRTALLSRPDGSGEPSYTREADRHRNKRSTMPPEIITFGEAMIRLSPPNFARLEQAQSLDVRVGGAELNTAVGLARLGRSTAWVSRLTDNPLGRLIANHAREAGVSTD